MPLRKNENSEQLSVIYIHSKFLFPESLFLDIGLLLPMKVSDVGSQEWNIIDFKYLT